MAVPYEKIVGEDLNTGYGSVSVSMPAGGTATGSKIGVHTFMGDTFNVKDFGVVGDAKHDDAADLQLALDAASSAHGRVIVPANCLMRVASALTCGGIRLVGESRDTSGIFVDFDGVGLTADADSLSTFELRNMTVCGRLVFDHILSTRTHQIGVKISTTLNCTVDNCRFVNLYEGLQIEGLSYYGNYQKNLFLENVIGLHTTELAGDGPSESNIAFNQFNGLPASEGGPGATTGILIDAGGAHKIIGNGIENLGVGIDLGDSEFCLLIGNRSEDNTTPIVQGTAANNMLVGGFDDRNYGFRDFVGIRLAASDDSDLNTCLGNKALAHNAVGTKKNTAIGSLALEANTTGTENTAVGALALNSVAAGTKNTAVGYGTLLSTLGSRNVALGFGAGLYYDGDDRLFIDDRDRGSAPNELTLALLVGLFAATAAAQRLRVNGRLAISVAPTYADNAAAVSGGLDVGEIYRITGSDHLAIVH